MNRSILRRSVATLALAAAVALPVGAQQTMGISPQYMGLSFEKGLGIDAASLFMVPVAVRLQPSQSFSFDLYSAWAEGRVEQNNVAYTLSGPVDTRVKVTYQATPWALLSVGANVPTGKATHDGEQAVVASVLSADLFGFRESTWGTGFGVTSSIATAMRAGQFGIGVAAAYALNGQFDPSSEQDLTYQPGNETRVRIGIDRNIGTSTVTAGAMFMTYTADQANGTNLFQAGNRMRFDATYQFRAGAGVWTLYGADLWREHGDLTLPFVDENGTTVGDTTYTTPSQNLVAVGLLGTIGVGGSYVFRPNVDLRVQKRQETAGSDQGSGWILAAGGDFPVRVLGRYDLFPKARFLFGAQKDAAGASKRITGVELSATIRWGF